MYRILSNRLFEELQKRAFTVSTMGSQLVDSQTVQRLVAELGPDLPADKVAAIESSPDFLAVSRTLNNVRNVDPELIRFVYLFRPTGNPNSDMYVVDADVVDDNKKVAAGGSNVGDTSPLCPRLSVNTFPLAPPAATPRQPSPPRHSHSYPG